MSRRVDSRVSRAEEHLPRCLDRTWSTSHREEPATRAAKIQRHPRDDQRLSAVPLRANDSSTAGWSGVTVAQEHAPHHRLDALDEKVDSRCATTDGTADRAFLVAPNDAKKREIGARNRKKTRLRRAKPGNTLPAPGNTHRTSFTRIPQEKMTLRRVKSHAPATRRLLMTCGYHSQRFSE